MCMCTMIARKNRDKILNHKIDTNMSKYGCLLFIHKFSSNVNVFVKCFSTSFFSCFGKLTTAGKEGGVRFNLEYFNNYLNKHLPPNTL